MPFLMGCVFSYDFPEGQVVRSRACSMSKCAALLGGAALESPPLQPARATTARRARRVSVLAQAHESLTHACEALDRGEQLLALLISGDPVARGQRIGDAVAHMSFKQL